MSTRLGYNCSDEEDEYEYKDEDEDEEKSEHESELGLDLGKLSLGPKRPKKLLVLSLNGFLIHRAHRDNRAETPNRRPDLTYAYGKRFVYKRPFLEEFIKFCLERFDVGLWSSAIEKNMDDVLDLVFTPHLKRRFVFIFDQENCTDYGFRSLEKKQKPLFFKELSKVWKNYSSSSSSSTTTSRFSELNTLLIDDKSYKTLLNPANTGIFPETYDPDDATDRCLDPKGELGKYLEGLVEAEDVPSYVKENPFGQPVIDEGHPDWSFYSKFIRQVNNKA